MLKIRVLCIPKLFIVILVSMANDNLNSTMKDIASNQKIYLTQIRILNHTSEKKPKGIIIIITK